MTPRPRPASQTRRPAAARLRRQARQSGARRPALAVHRAVHGRLVLRILTQIAYRPALLYIDSTKYLLNAYPGDDPPGYQLASSRYSRSATWTWSR